MKILVVDDEQNIRDVLKEFLTDEGHQVSIASDGKLGIEKFKSEEYDIVFMDIKMPGIDGIETFRHMKQMKPQTKVIVMTGMTDEITFDRAVSVSPGSIEAFLPKPFKPNDIKNCIQKIMSGEKLASFDLTKDQTDALTKVGNTCAENSVKAFQQVLKREIKIGLKKINIGELKNLYKDDPATVIVLLTELTGEISGKVAVLISWDNGFKLVDMLKKRPLGVTKTYDENAQIVLKAVGNLFSGACLNAVQQLLKLSSQSSMPKIVFNKKGEISKTLLKEFGSEMSSNYIVGIEAVLHIVEPDIACEILLIPSLDSLKKILQNLGTLEK